MNQGKNAISEMIKGGFHDCEKRFFTDEILNFPKPLLAWASHRWSIATVFAEKNSYIGIISPVNVFYEPLFLKEGLG